MIKRYNMEICRCDMGPHIEEKEDSLGDWVRYSDLPKWIPVSDRHPTTEYADEKCRVLCLLENGTMASCTVEQFKYRTIQQYMGYPVIKWSRMPEIENE
jgi:hypothetical protein